MYGHEWSFFNLWRWMNWLQRIDVILLALMLAHIVVVVIIRVSYCYRLACREEASDRTFQHGRRKLVADMSLKVGTLNSIALVAPYFGLAGRVHRHCDWIPWCWYRGGVRTCHSDGRRRSTRRVYYNRRGTGRSDPSNIVLQLSPHANRLAWWRNSWPCVRDKEPILWIRANAPTGGTILEDLIPLHSSAHSSYSRRNGVYGVLLL